MDFTANQWAIVGFVFVLGWVLGLLSRSGSGKWRRAYDDERARNEALRTEHDVRVKAANARIAELERHEPIVGAGTATTVAGAATIGAATVGAVTVGRDDLSRIRGISGGEEVRLNEAGILSYHDVAAMSATDEAALEARLGYDSGRITREQWREQAELLARGRLEETRFT